MATTFDIFGIARTVTRAWLAEDTGDARADVLQALSAPQDGGKGKAERRLTTGWFVAGQRGGWHRLDAKPKRSITGLERGENIAAVLGTETLREPFVVVELGKAGLKVTDFAISYGDQLRIGEAGKGVRLIDLRRVRALLPLMVSKGKPSARKVHDWRRALTKARLGGEADLPAPEIAAVVEAATDADIAYAIKIALNEHEKRTARLKEE